MTASGGTLDVDVGNSRVKWRYTADSHVVRGVFDRASAALDDALTATWDRSLRPSRIRVSSVAGAEFDATLANSLSATFAQPPRFARTGRTAGGVTCAYRDPARMGVDRWLMLLAGWSLVRARFVVASLGTASTIDFVDASGNHRGGYIVPGPVPMIEGLSASTAGVRVAPPSVFESLEPGDDTVRCVQHGVARMLVDFVEQSVTRFDREGPASLLLCGGGVEAIRGHLAVPSRWEPDLVLDGLAVALP